MQLIMTWAVVLSLLIGGVFGAGSGEQPARTDETAAVEDAAVEVAAAEDAADFQATEEPSGSNETEDRAGDFLYEHYDPASFYEDADRLAALSDRADAEAAEALYDSLYERMETIDTLDQYAMIRHYADLNDMFWSDEYAYTDTVWMEMSDALCTAAASVLDTAIGERFAAHIGEDMTAYLADYKPMTDEQIEAQDRVLELLEEYYSLTDSMGDISVEYLGETWTLDAFHGFRGDTLYRNDYEGYFTVYEGLNKALCEAFAPIYIELAGLYRQEAVDAGYDSYAEYAYENIYGRDYTPEQAQAFCDAVKPICAEYYGDLYYSRLFSRGMRADMDTQALLTVLETCLPRLDESLTEPFRCLADQSLYDIAPAGGGRYGGSFETELVRLGTPFLFLTTNGAPDDLISLTHEFGHFSYSYFHPVPNVVASVGAMDLFEIHSNGMQALFTNYYPDIYGGESNTAAFVNVADLLENVIDGCLFDEFERRAMAEADSLTAERLNEIYLELCLEYGIYDRDDMPAYDAMWVYIGHLFEAPMYYISYAASGFAALQLWDISRTDMDSAKEIYMKILGSDAYHDSYLSVVSGCGLRTLDEEDAVGTVLSSVLRRLSQMERAAG